LNDSTKIIQKYLNETISKKELKTLAYYIKHPTIKEQIVPTLQLEADLRSVNGSIDVVSKTMDQIQNRKSRPNSTSDSKSMKRVPKKSSTSKRMSSKTSTSKRMSSKTSTSRRMSSETSTSRRMSSKTSIARKIPLLRDEDEHSSKAAQKKQELLYMSMAGLGLVIIGVIVILYHMSTSSTPAFMARATKVFGQVQAIRGTDIVMIKDDSLILDGDKLVVSDLAECHLSYELDGSKLVLAKTTKVDLSIKSGSKIVDLHNGIIHGLVTKQEKGKAMILSTRYSKTTTTESQFRLSHISNNSEIFVSEGSAIFESASGIKRAIIDKGENAEVGAKIPFRLKK